MQKDLRLYYSQAHKAQKMIMTTPMPKRAASDQPQPVIQARVLAMAAGRSLRRFHSARNNPAGEATMPTSGEKVMLTTMPAAKAHRIELQGTFFSRTCFAMM